MIQPNHLCYYSSHHQSTVRYRDGIFYAAGTSLPVLMDAFRDEPLRWYSREYGHRYRGTAENLRLIAVDSSDREAEELTEEIRDRLQIGDEEAGFEPQDWARVRCTIHLHDDCFAMVQPVDSALLRRLLLGTLRLHSYYLQTEVNWSGVLDELTALLQRTQWFQLTSHPRQQSVAVEWPRRGELVAWPRPEQLPVVRMDVRDQTAHLSRIG